METMLKNHDCQPTIRGIFHSDKSDLLVTYEGAIATVDISSLIRRLGFQCDHGRSWSLWIVKDLCGIACALLTWLLILFSEFGICYFILLPSVDVLHSVVNGIIFIGISCLAVFSHVMAMFTNPGAVPIGNATKENIGMLRLRDGQIAYRCPKCVSIKPNRAHHCRICRRCIRKMDHHCPWINNCVGENNQKFFILFTMYISAMSIHGFYLIIRHLILCAFSLSKECSTDFTVLSTVTTILLLFEAVIFFTFTSIMFCTQVSSVWSDTTGIEMVKNESHLWVRKAGWQSIKLVFGRQFSYRWFFPVHSSLRKMESYDYDYSV